MTNAKVRLFSDIEKLEAERTAKKCCVEGCENIGKRDLKRNTFYLIEGMCYKHYRRFKMHGDPNIVSRIRDESRSNNPLYTLYMNMIGRCSNKNNKNFENYGGRGIKVCDKWLGAKGFSQFVLDMGERPINHTLDRKDVNKGYSKENCRWASWHEQQSNKRNNNKVVGVGYYAKRNIWTARLRVGRTIHQKIFKSEQDAIAYRVELEDKYL